MPFTKYYCLLIFAFLLAQCNEDDDDAGPTCETYSVDLGPFYMAETTRNLFPYTIADSLLVLKNQDGQELHLSRYFFEHDTLLLTYPIQCPFDSLAEVPYTREFEIQLITFSNDSADISFQYTFEGNCTWDGSSVTGEYDRAYLFFSTVEPETFSTVSNLIIHKTGTEPLFLNNYYPTITLGSKTFEDVYSNYSFPQKPSRYLLYMNYENGIVGFEDTEKNELWVFDRIE